MAKKIFLLLFLVLMTNVMSFAQNLPLAKGSYLPCPTGWNTYAGSPSCYIVPKPTKRWHMARKVCLAYGGDLVTLSSEQENNFVALLSHTYFPASYSIWIGMIAEELPGKKQGKFHWVDGTTIGQYSNWYTGEPNNHDQLGNPEYCGSINILKSRRGMKWNDMKCVYTSKLPFVCETERAKRA